MLIETLNKINYSFIDMKCQFATMPSIINSYEENIMYQSYEGKLKRKQPFYRVWMAYPRTAPMEDYKGVHQQAKDYGQSYEIILEQFLLNSRTADNNQ